VHGDFHGNNFFLNHKEDRVVFTDFSEIGVGDPMSEIVQYVISNIETSHRREHEMEMLKFYHDQLVKGGVTDFSFEDCVKGYK
jgi:aminoglycoside phosphotransferase (APT) family kinase protein